MDTSAAGPAISGTIVSTTPPMIRLAMAAYLARFKGQSRVHTESDLRGYLDWCQQHDLDPLAATQPHLELYLRWLQEVRRFKPSTVSRRMSVVTGFYGPASTTGPRELPGRLRPSSRGAGRVFDAASEPSAVRGDTGSRKAVNQ